MSNLQEENNHAGAQSRAEGANLTDVLGAAVIVRGTVVAWFAEFDEAAADWCRENHFGEWLTWRAKRPEIVPLTDEEHADVQRRAAEFTAKLRELPEAPNE